MKFEKELREGLIMGRPNRFIMNVLIDNRVEVCHCPCTGRIANVVFDKIPCLLSEGNPGKNRKTRYTVEAISLNNPGKTPRNWIGINQTRANSYMECFLRSGQLSDLVKSQGDELHIKREQKVGESRIDFMINSEIYLEVKSPMVFLPLRNSYLTNHTIEFAKITKLYAIDRFFKHMDELSKHKRAIIVVFFMFEAERFAPKPEESDSEIAARVKNTRNSGVEFWQVNTKFTAKDIKLVSYYSMQL
jgi:sugar fermentation stimulation protein A